MLLPNPMENLEPAHAGHFYIQKQKIRVRIGKAIREFTPAGDVVDCLLAVADKSQLSWHSGLLKSALEEKRVVGVIFSDQNIFGLAHGVHGVSAARLLAVKCKCRL